MAGSKASRAKKTPTSEVLAVGPLPPPLDGTSVSFQVFCQEASSLLPPEGLNIVDSSPRELKDEGHRHGWSDLRQAARILGPFLRRIPSTDRILIFGSNGFLLKMAPILLLAARLAGKPCYIRPFGGSLDTFWGSLPRIPRRLLTWALRSADGVLVQTQLLSRNLQPLIGRTPHVVSGYRPVSDHLVEPTSADRHRSDVRLCFVGHIREEKGVLLLLEALRRLSELGDSGVSCDLYGPIYQSVQSRFRDDLERTPSARFMGMLPADRVIPTMQTYDALVFPSYYDGEGHPGVLIEAMMAGLPIIASDHRALAEVVEHEVNGLLIKPRDVQSLTEALTRIVNSRELRQAMATRSQLMAKQYDSRSAVRLILSILGIALRPPNEAPGETTL